MLGCNSRLVRYTVFSVMLRPGVLLLRVLVAYHLYPLLIHIPPAASLSFNFDFANPSTFSLKDDLRFDGDAAFHDRWVDLTTNEYTGSIKQSLGRVSYSQPVPIWDKATGELASFETRFTFVIKLPNRDDKGDGMAFFLSSYPSNLDPNSGGGNLGLYGGGSDTTASDSDRFLAVEFDTFNNTWDPNVTYDHIGIDINSIVSAAPTTLPSFSLEGQMTATVRYDNKTKLLGVVLNFDNAAASAPPPVQLSTRADLRNSLPQQVAVGFSAATGMASELHQILSWSFSSTLNSTAPPPSSPPAASASPVGSTLKTDKGIYTWIDLSRGLNHLRK